MRAKIIIGNWKMNKTVAEATTFIQAAQDIATKASAKGIILGVAPAFLALATVKNIEGKLITVAQNCHFAPSGAFTGEVSIPMLKEIGVTYVLVGHSERRQYFGETNATCHEKLVQLVANSMTPVYCVGETLTQFENNQTEAVVKEQLRVGLAGLPASSIASMVIAYEPVWSIGTGKNADATIAERVCRFIREEIREMVGSTTADAVLIQYGGSVKPQNVAEYLSQPNIDGALVGGASLQIDSFTQLVTPIL
jgi:triosephosphate isomerase